MKADIKIILIVDDSPNDVELTINSLAEANLANEVVVAEDGVEALDYLNIGQSSTNHPLKHLNSSY